MYPGLYARKLLCERDMTILPLVTWIACGVYGFSSFLCRHRRLAACSPHQCEPQIQPALEAADTSGVRGFVYSHLPADYFNISRVGCHMQIVLTGVTWTTNAQFDHICV